jgi:hypothetical protein
MAAGEEIEQPFGYGGHMYSCILYLLTMTPDKNDLDLDFFCRQVIRADLEDIRHVSCPNSDLGIPGAVEKDSLSATEWLLTRGGVSKQHSAFWAWTSCDPNATLAWKTTGHVDIDIDHVSDPNATSLVGRQQGTSTQRISRIMHVFKLFLWVCDDCLAFSVYEVINHQHVNYLTDILVEEWNPEDNVVILALLAPVIIQSNRSLVSKAVFQIYLLLTWDLQILAAFGGFPFSVS